MPGRRIEFLSVGRSSIVGVHEEIAAELEHTRFAAVVGYPSTARLLEHRLHLSCGEANARTRDVVSVGPRRVHR